MSTQAMVPAPDQDAAVLPPDALAVIKAVAQAFILQSPRATTPTSDEKTAKLPRLLAPGQVADLLGFSRNTVDRMVADAELPSVVLRRGARQQMVRIPKAFVLAMLKDLDAGTSIPSLKEYAARWTAQAALRPEGTLVKGAVW